MSRYIISTGYQGHYTAWLCRQLRASYWGHWLNDKQIHDAMQNSLCFWMECYEDDGVGYPVGFVRIVTDGHIFSSITDCFIIEGLRGQGLGRKLMEHTLQHSAVAKTICILATRDATGFYRRLGFHSNMDPVMTRSPV